MDIGKAIKKTRLERNMTQNVLAKKAGISQTSLSQIENGAKQPKYATLLHVADALQVSVGFLYFRALDKNDFPKNKQALFDTLYPTLQHIMIQLI